MKHCWRPKASVLAWVVLAVWAQADADSALATVQGKGNLLIGKAYTALLDLKPGDEFEIKLGRKQIRLTPVGATDEDDE